MAALLVLAGCAGPPDSIPSLFIGPARERVNASDATSGIWVEARVDGEPGPQVLVDTGSPFALLYPQAFHGAVPNGAGTVASLALGETTLWKVPTLGIDGAGAIAPDGGPMGGVLGYSVFGQFAVSFNFRDRQLALGTVPFPDGVLPAVVTPFSLEGGGAGQLPGGGAPIAFSASRVLLSASVESIPVTLMFDSGASWVVLESALLASLTADGRPTLATSASLARGTATVSLTRVRRVSLAEAQVDDVVGAASAGTDELLTTLSQEVGRPVEGLLGAEFLRHYYATVDYPRRFVELRRYADEEFLVDSYQRVGIELAFDAAREGYLVAQVYPGTNAEEQGIRIGDIVRAVDGTSLVKLGPAAAERTLLGTVGTLRHVDFENRAVDVRVDDLLPTSPPASH